MMTLETMTIEEKQDALRDFGAAIAEAKRYVDNGNEFFILTVGAWEIRFDRCGIAKGEGAKRDAD